jgi:hypothetical protein
MSRTVRPTRSPSRRGMAGLAGVAAALLLTACGGDGGGSGADSTGAAGADPGETTASAGADPGETATSAGAGEFCTQAADIDERVDSALADMEDDDPSVSEAFHQIATELRGITPPEAITADWESMAAGLDRMADAFADLDITDLDSLDSLDEAEGDLTEASTNVDDYLSEECGI